MPQGRKEKFYTSKSPLDGSVTVVRKGSKLDKYVDKIQQKNKNKHKLDANGMRNARGNTVGTIAKATPRRYANSSFGYDPSE